MTGRLAVGIVSVAFVLIGGGYCLVDPGWLRRLRARRRAQARRGWLL